jgi:hypothetical protein
VTTRLPTHIGCSFLRKLGACDSTICVFSFVFNRRAARMNVANLTKFLLRWSERTDFGAGYTLSQLAGMLRAGGYWSPDMTLRYQMECSSRIRSPYLNARLFMKYWGMARREQRRR